MAGVQRYIAPTLYTFINILFTIHTLCLTITLYLVRLSFNAMIVALSSNYASTCLAGTV